MASSAPYWKPGKGAAIAGLLADRQGIPTDVRLRDGTLHRVINSSIGRDIGEDWEHVLTNVTPVVEMAPKAWFLTSEVVTVSDPDTSQVLWANS